MLLLRRPPQARSIGVLLGPGGQDALDRAVGRVTGGGGLRAGGFEPAGLVLVSQAEDTLGGAEPVQGVVFQQPADQRGAGRADLGGSLPAPGRGAHMERDLLRRVVTQVGLLALSLADVGLDQIAAGEQLHRRRGRPGIEGLADVPPRHRVQGPADLDMDVGTDLAPRPLRQHERMRRQRSEGVLLRRGEHRGRGGAVQRPAVPLPCYLRGPVLGTGLHLLQLTTIPGRARSCPGYTASAARPAACREACGTGPDRPGSRNGRPARHRSG